MSNASKRYAKVIPLLHISPIKYYPVFIIMISNWGLEQAWGLLNKKASKGGILANEEALCKKVRAENSKKARQATLYSLLIFV
jgi:hypothetical protein